VPTFDAVREAGAGDSLLTPACSSPLAVALRPCVAARSPMSGASLSAMKADGSSTSVRVLVDSFAVGVAVFDPYPGYERRKQ
jgi:hypothetical protein